MSSRGLSNKEYVASRVAAEEKYGAQWRGFIMDWFILPRRIIVSDDEGNRYHDSDGWTKNVEIITNLREPAKVV